MDPPSPAPDVATPDSPGSIPTTSSASYPVHSPLLTRFDRFASGPTRWAGSPRVLRRVLTALAWAAIGRYSTSRELAADDQHRHHHHQVSDGAPDPESQSQKKDSVAVHLKLERASAVEQAGGQPHDRHRRPGWTVPSRRGDVLRQACRARGNRRAEQGNTSIDDEGHAVTGVGVIRHPYAPQGRVSYESWRRCLPEFLRPPN